MAVDKSVAFFPLSGLGAATDTPLVAAVPNARIRVLGAVFSSGAAAATAVLNSKGSGAGTAISGIVNLGINGGHVWPPSDIGYCETGYGEGLSVTTTGTGPATVLVVYGLVYRR